MTRGSSTESRPPQKNYHLDSESPINTDLYRFCLRRFFQLTFTGLKIICSRCLILHSVQFLFVCLCPRRTQSHSFFIKQMKLCVPQFQGSGHSLVPLKSWLQLPNICHRPSRFWQDSGSPGTRAHNQTNPPAL